MPVITCWAVKGGSGTTVVTAGLALALARPSIVVDLAGDQAAALGLAEPAGQGLAEWFTSTAPADAVVDLAVEVDDTTSLVPTGAAPIPHDADRWDELAAWMADDERLYVVDAGTTTAPPPALTAESGDADVTGRTDLLVTRPCYLSLRRAHAARRRPDGVVVVADTSHSLGRADVARSLASPVVAEVPLDPAIARAVDAGLVAFGLPGNLAKPLRRVALPRRPAERDVVPRRLSA